MRGLDLMDDSKDGSSSEEIIVIDSIWIICVLIIATKTIHKRMQEVEDVEGCPASDPMMSVRFMYFFNL